MAFMRFHIHDWRWRSSGYIHWVPGEGRQWLMVFHCTKCDELRCTIRDTTDDKGWKSWITTAPYPAL